MKIVLKVIGTMQAYFPASELDFSLDENATLSDLYNEIGRTAGPQISQAVWNHDKSRPRGPVIMRSDDRVLKDEAHPLYEGQVLELKRFLIGG